MNRPFGACKEGKGQRVDLFMLNPSGLRPDVLVNRPFGACKEARPKGPIYLGEGCSPSVIVGYFLSIGLAP